MPASPFPNFRDASDAALTFLQEHYPMGLWMVTRAVGDDWIVLRAQDRSYDVSDGDLFRWSDSFCSRMVTGRAPNIAPDSRIIPAYAEAPIGKHIPIASYIGFPLEAEGEMFGTLCAIDTVTKPDDLKQAEELIRLLARLLSTILESDLRTNRLSALAESLATAADRDELTGLLNRRGWNRLLALAEANRSTYGHANTVVMIDLDGLKTINDTYGHTAGDEALQRAAEAITRASRTPDITARLGGDEFGVLLSEPISLDPEPYLTRLRTALTEAGVSGAVGAAMSGPNTTLEEALLQADEHMYEAKRAQSGRDSGR